MIATRRYVRDQLIRAEAAFDERMTRSASLVLDRFRDVDRALLEIRDEAEKLRLKVSEMENRRLHQRRDRRGRFKRAKR